jgi:hypothetical protein
MIVKALVGAALLAAPASVAPAVPLAGQMIPKVVCPVYAGPLLLGYSMGSAVRVSEHLLLSVKHVTNFDGCLVNGKPIQKVWTSPDKDVSIFKTEDGGPFLKVDCGGFVKGRIYEALGHARGLDELTVVELIGTGIINDGYSVLKGILTVIPGQSGGAVTDKETGKFVGLVNAYDMPNGNSFSIALKDTPICSKIGEK